jgi:hypothetical protein
MSTRKSSKKYDLHVISVNKTLKTPWKAFKKKFYINHIKILTSKKNFIKKIYR